MMSDVWEDLRFFAEHLRNLPVSESIALGNNGGFCVSTNNEFENWVYYPETVRDIETVKRATTFFGRRKETFMWPVYDGGNNILEAAGLLHAGHLEAMSLEPTHAVRDRVNPSVKMRAVTRETFVQWANCEWSAFEYGDGEPSAEYLELAKAFSKDESMSMYIAEIDGHDAGAFLVTHEAELMGVYYFATKPEFRRKGVAASMMSEICRLSGGRKIVLQATPSGVPFYSAFGFEDLGAIEVYSTRADIF